MDFIFVENNEKDRVDGHIEEGYWILGYTGDTSVKKIICPDMVFDMPVIGIRSLNGVPMNVDEIILPKNLRYIGNAAMQSLLNLKSINLPEGLLDIDNAAFAYTGLTEVVFPKSIRRIGVMSFFCCNDLVSVTIPKSKLDTIPENSFGSCNSLTTFSFERNVKVIESNAFSNTAFTEFNIKNVEDLGPGVFIGCKSLTKVKLGNKINIIPERLFGGCVSLTSVRIPLSVKELGSECFRLCKKLKSLTIPEGVEKIGNDFIKGTPLELKMHKIKNLSQVEFI